MRSSGHRLGSYAAAEFPEVELERSRLEEQAEIGLEIEREVWNRLGIRSGMRILDVGSGPGIVSAALARTFEGSDVTGIDADPGAIERARWRVADMPEASRPRFELGDLHDAPGVPDESFDVAYARFVFQHLADPVLAAKTIARALVPGGVLGIVDVDDRFLMIEPKSDALERLVDHAGRAQSSAGGDRRVGGDLRRVLLEAGYESVSLFVRVVTSDEVGAEAFTRVIVGYKSQLVRGSMGGVVDDEVQELLESSARPDFFGAVGLFCARGVRP